MSFQNPPGGTSYPVRTSNMALVSLIAGILGLSIFPIVGSIIAVITGPMARREIQESVGGLGGDGMAIAGIVLGWIGIALGVLGLCLFGTLLVLPLCLFSSGNINLGSGWLAPALLSFLF